MGMYNDVPLTEFGLDCGPGVTKQSFKDECDINKIIARFEKTGMISRLSSKTPMFLDVSEIGDYHTALDTVRKAEELFMELSAEVRERFGNDPGKLLEFMNDSNNKNEAVKLGIVQSDDPVSAADTPILPKPVEVKEEVKK